jgi:2-C-methyl-D-erythritol 4-phosphate cytidylyltransferase/2-C-methyl-D-erythritol 2,4-cyclodiphosphate synthase
MRVLAIIPAAGSGSRFGGDIPKQFRPLAGKPVLLHVVERFFVDERIAQIVVAVAEPLLANVKQTERARFVAGGPTRQQSVARALEAAGDGFDVVAVHDAVRPFFASETLHALIDAAGETGGALPALPVSDTIHIVGGDGTIASTPDRDTLAAAQTPQCFRAEVLRDALARAERDGFEATDEAALAARYGHRVRVLPGDPLNFKITLPEDLERAERLMAEIGAS